MAVDQEILSEEEGGPSKEDCVLGAVCYAPVGFLLPLFMQKESPFLSFHTRQGGIIFGVYFILNIVPLPGLFWLLTLVYLGLAGFAGWKAYNGEMYSYEFINALIEKFKK